MFEIDRDFDKQKLLSAAFEQVDSPILITTAELDLPGPQIVFVNRAFVRLTGYSADELIGQTPRVLQGAKTDRAALVKLREDLSRGRTFAGETYNYRKDGSVYYLEWNISPIKNEGGRITHFVSVQNDATTRKALDAIAEAVNMMENVGYVFSGIRHELGNPINSIKTALSVLRKNIDEWEKEQAVTYIERCLTEIGRVEYLLRALKTFSMHENPKMQRISLDSFMRNFIALIENDFATRGIAVELLESDVGEAWCDARALHQVMLNLAANADHALENRADARITINLKRDERFVHVAVGDNGAGMSALQIENLFKPFYTSKAEGTGLGLVIVKKMIAKMNGTIYLESNQNVGTTVHFTLEAAAPEK